MADLNTGYIFEIKLLEQLVEKEKNGKIITLVTEFMNSLNGGNNKKYILCTDRLYTSEELLDNNNCYFIGAIRSNRIQSNKIEILEKIKKKVMNTFIE